MSETHSRPPLLRPLVAEAVFEFRFEPIERFSLVPGRLFDKLQDRFPESEELPLAQVPPEFGPPNGARHRFKSADKTRMYQVGTGMISINHVNYSSYDALSEDCDLVWEVARSLNIVSGPTRLGLRYINKAPLDRPWNEILSLSLAAPGALSDRVFSTSLTWMLDCGKGDSLKAVFGWPTLGEKLPHLVLDLDYFNEKRQIGPDEVAAWRHRAHDQVHDAFTASLQPEYLSYLRGTS